MNKMFDRRIILSLQDIVNQFLRSFSTKQRLKVGPNTRKSPKKFKNCSRKHEIECNGNICTFDRCIDI